MKTMEIESISRETIKPSAPTLPHQTIYHLSLIDNIVAPNYVPLIYFYPNEPHESSQVCDQGSKILMLKKSLSKVLSIYYPLAGRLKDKPSIIECNDQGVSLLVTRINSNQSEILQNPSEALLSPLFPDELPWNVIGSSASLVVIQINFFACGGIAISLCMCHKVGDVSTLFNFVNDWATLNRNSNTEEGEFIFPAVDAGASMFPQGDLPVLPEFTFVKHNNTVCRRFVFEGSKIESLKAKATVVSSSHKVENPTRIEVIIALIYECAVSALRLTPKNTPFRVSINLRKRMDPPLPEKSLGNLVWSFYASNQSNMDKEDPKLHELVSRIREGLCEFCDKNVKNFGDLSFFSEFLKQITTLPKKKEATSTSVTNKEKQSSFFFSSWCRFPTYEADFGWGKPIWVTAIGCPMRNTIILMDTRDGNGIEALVNLEEEDMAVFESDVELLQYGSLYPDRWTC